MWTVVEYVALGLALVGAVALLLGRFGRPAPMSWLDAIMGACATGALLVPAGPVIAVAGGGIVGVLALSRWRLRPQESGPQFSPVVLAAILTFAVVGLGLLLVGQFVDISPVAASLAAVTVLTGTARAGLPSKRTSPIVRQKRTHGSRRIVVVTRSLLSSNLLEPILARDWTASDPAGAPIPLGSLHQSAKGERSGVDPAGD